MSYQSLIWYSGLGLKKAFFTDLISVTASETSLITSFRVRINISWFRKYDAFLIFHDAVFPTKPKNHDTKTYEKGKIVFSLIKAGWIVVYMAEYCIYFLR